MSQHRDVVVIGAGVAGLSAAREVAAAGRSVACIDKLGPGGVLINLGPLHDMPGGEGEISGPDLVAKLVDQASEAGVELVFAEVERLEAGAPWTLSTTDGDWTADVVILATGLAPGKLGVTGEEAFEGMGISHCASCDGPLYAGQDVLVTGSDRWAIQEAIELAGMTKHVTLLLEPGAVAAAGADELRALPNASVWTGRVVGLEGSNGVDGAIIERDGTSAPLAVRGLFVYSQRRPAADLIAQHANLAPDGGVAVDADRLSSRPTLLAAGDVAAGATHRIANAIADGRHAGRTAVAHLKPQ